MSLTRYEHIHVSPRRMSPESLRDSLMASGLYQSIPLDEPGGDGDRQDAGTAVPSRFFNCPDVEGDKFNILVGTVIVMNAIVLGLETDFGQVHFLLFEHFFNGFFTLEMAVRFSQLGCRGYFMKVSNAFDFILVCTGDFDLWLSPMLMGPQSKHNASATMLKLLRMFRVMRIVRLFKMFRQLQLILEAFVNALGTVMWVGLLTLILNYVCAVFLTQTIGHNAEMWGDKKDDVLLWFGTVGASIRTLFIIITLAEWDEIALTISEQVNSFAVFTFAIAYITITAFTMVSLITGIISEELVRGQRDEEELKNDMIDKGRAKFIDSVALLLSSLDDDKSGTLSPEELVNALKDPELNLTTKLQALSIHLDEADLSDMIEKLKAARGSDEVCIDELADALKQISGNAGASEVWDLKMILLQLHVKVSDCMGTLRATVLDVSSESASKLDAALNRLDELEAKLQSTIVPLSGRFDDVSSTQEAPRTIGQYGKLQSDLQGFIIGTSESKAAFDALGQTVGMSSNNIENIRCQLERLEAELQTSSAQSSAMFQEVMKRMAQVIDRCEECAKSGAMINRMAQVIDRNEELHREQLQQLVLLRSHTCEAVLTSHTSEPLLRSYGSETLLSLHTSELLLSSHTSEPLPSSHSSEARVSQPEVSGVSSLSSDSPGASALDSTFASMAEAETARDLFLERVPQ